MAPKRKRNDVVSGEKAVRRSTRSRSSLAADAKSETNARSDVDLAARPELDSGQKNESILGNGQAAVRNTKKESKTATIGDKGHGESVKALRAEGVSAKQSTASGRSYWLMKAEPESRMEKGIDVKFSIDDLEACTEPEPWTGVRNHVAKNNMKAMKKGELAFFYHSNCKTPGIAGIMEIVQESSVDESAFDAKHPYYDPKSDREKPRWFHVHVGFKEKFSRFISLKELQTYKGSGQALENMQLHKQSRLSVSKVNEDEWNFILGLAKEGT